MTSAGGRAGLDLCLHIIRCDLGAEIAALTARLVVMPLERAGGQAQFIVHQPPGPADSTAMGPLLVWIEKNLHKDLSLAAIARQAAMSTRTVSRRFLERVGAAPAQWVATARVRRAQQLLETTGLSVEEVAVHSGLSSASVLARAFQKKCRDKSSRVPAKFRSAEVGLTTQADRGFSAFHAARESM